MLILQERSWPLVNDEVSSPFHRESIYTATLKDVPARQMNVEDVPLVVFMLLLLLLLLLMMMIAFI